MNRDRVSSPEPRLQFGLRDVLIIQAVVAVFCGLLAVAGVFGVVAAFVATFCYAVAPVGRANLPLKRWLVSLLGGVILPCLCIVYDPGVFRPGDLGYFTASYQSFAYLLLSFQMVSLLAWLVAGSWMGRWAGFLAGTLYVGSLVALLIGIAMLPLSLVGTMYALVGLSGFTPFLTAHVYWTNGTRALRYARACGSPRLAAGLAWLGVALAVAVPGAVYWVAGGLLSRALESLAWPRFWPFE